MQKSASSSRTDYAGLLVNYAVSVKEVWCDKVDKDENGDRGDGVTQLTGRQGVQAIGCTGLYWAVLACTGLF